MVLNIEGFVSEIIELGGRNEDHYHAFSEETLNFIVRLFPCDIALTEKKTLV